MERAARPNARPTTKRARARISAAAEPAAPPGRARPSPPFAERRATRAPIIRNAAPGPASTELAPRVARSARRPTTPAPATSIAAAASAPEHKAARSDRARLLNRPASLDASWPVKRAPLARVTEARASRAAAALAAAARALLTRAAYRCASRRAGAVPRARYAGPTPTVAPSRPFGGERPRATGSH